MIEINGYKFDGGGSCPEQYDVYKDDKYVAYVRFRWGSCTVHTEPLGEYIYSYDNFDAWQGNFDSERQRMYYLKLITKQIEKYYQPKKPKRKYHRKTKYDLHLSPEFTKLLVDSLFNFKVDLIGDKYNIENVNPKLNKFKDYRKYKNGRNNKKRKRTKI